MAIARQRNPEIENNDERRFEPRSAPRGGALPERTERSDRSHEPPQAKDERRAGEKAAKKASLQDTLRAHTAAVAAAAVAAILLIIGGIAWWWLHARHFESTDDAFIDARIATISS